jgi:hypothetical protein
MKRYLLLFLLLFSFVCFAQNFKFLGNYTTDGTPQYFATSDIVSAETINLIKNSLPENYPVPAYNPQYLSSGYDTDLLLEKDADVWVTFVSEGAGYRNVLGFYTYDITNPPTVAPSANDITIVFPNVSAAGSGGSLLTGNKVKIGTFAAGTGIGWVLLANGWNGTQVTNGLWRLFSNPNFNPESSTTLRQHNVLLKDPENQRIILGFEDIRRDNSSCDNDFNDAVFYVSANPFEAFKIYNVADVSSATNVSSANNGGLESNGDLATLIAKRNFKRIKSNSFADKKELQKKFFAVSNLTGKTVGNDFASLLPTTAMYGTETTYVSSPTDLLGITNAKQVYSVDYYEGINRVAAVLATETVGGIYSHSKAICDRLNSSALEDIRTIEMNGYEIIMVKLKRANGLIEYALNFSMQQLASENKLHSYWNLEQYPSGDYLNFQIWGSSMGQVSSIANSILEKFAAKGKITADIVSNRVPTVFVKKGFYKNGQLHLSIINKSGASNIIFEGNKKATELSATEFVSQNISLSGSYEQDVISNLGGIFDIGFSVLGNKSMQMDALYLADGPWGLDYAKIDTKVDSFTIDNNVNSGIANEQYAIERNAIVTGSIYGTMNLFRNILPGELVFDANGYTAIGFKIQNSMPVEVVLITDNTTDWNDRLRFQLPVNATLLEINVLLDKFINPKGRKYNNEKIKGIVFSVQGNYSAFQPFEINVSQLAFKTAGSLGTSDFANEFAKSLFSYPNPCQISSTLVLPKITESASVQVMDLSGRILIAKSYNTIPSNNEIQVALDNLSKGAYLFIVTTKENEKLQTKFIVE